MTLSDDFAREKASVERTSLNFIDTELAMARTFCKISKETKDAEKRERNMEHAARAFQSAVKAFRDFSEPGDDWTRTKAALDDVERELTCLGWSAQDR